MEFLKLVFLELIFLVCGGLIFFGGIRGLLTSGIVLSGINYWISSTEQFLKWEIVLIIGIFLGFGVLYWINYKARETQMSIGLMGGFIGLVVFGAFVTPILALFLWMLTIGLGLLAGIKFKELLWSIAPTLWRTVLALGIIVYGNIIN